MNIRELARDLIPPLLFREFRKRLHLPGDITWEDHLPDWKSAAARCGGYGDDEILARVLAATRAVVRGDAVYERDATLFDHIEYSWPLLACLLRVAALRGHLRVLDFGGSLGATLRQNSRFLSDLPQELAWNVVEQKNFVEAGRREFQDGVLSFHSTIPEAAVSGLDVVLLAGVIQYLESPELVIDQLNDTDAEHMIFDRTMIVDGPNDVISIQHIPATIYRASFPVRKLSQDRLFGNLLKGWRIIERWTCDLQPDPTSTSIGFFCERVDRR